MNEQKRAREVLDDLLKLDKGLLDGEITFIEGMDKCRDSPWFDEEIEMLDELYSSKS